MLKESQKLQYVVTEVQGPSIKAEFTDCKASIQLPMEKVMLLSFSHRHLIAMSLRHVSRTLWGLHNTSKSK